MISKPTLEELEAQFGEFATRCYAAGTTSTDNPAVCAAFLAHYNGLPFPTSDERTEEHSETEDEFLDLAKEVEEYGEQHPPEAYGEPHPPLPAIYRFIVYFRDEQDEPVISHDDITDDVGLRWLLSDDPIRTLQAATICARYVFDDPSLHVELVNMPTENPSTTIEGLRAETHDSALVYVDAHVASISQVFQRLYRVRGRCPADSSAERVEEEWQDRFATSVEEPEECTGCVDCPNRELIIEPSHYDYVSAQEAVIQDIHLHTDKSTPDELPVGMDGQFVQRLSAGDEVTLALVILTDDSVKGPRGRFYGQVVGIHQDDEEFDTVDVTEEDEERIEELSARDDIHEVLADSIAPELNGGQQYALARQAIIHQLAGGASAPQSKTRDVIHVGFVGDPGTGKSHLAEAAYRIAPKSAYASGESSSAVGITATVQREERFGADEWVVSGGALVQASGGLCVIDELDKASEDVQKSLNQPLASQKLTVRKADIDATLRCETSVLIVANPVKSRFDLMESLKEQIGIDDSLFTRFDVIVPFVDDPSRETDAAAMSKFDPDANARKERLDEETLTKYFAVARRYEPVTTSEAFHYLKEEYVSIRDKSDRHRGHLSITARQGEGMFRLAAASAKIRLSETIEIEDVERARDMLMASLKLVATDRFGNLDADALTAGPSAAQRKEREIVFTCIEEMYEAKKGPISETDLYDVCNREDVPDHRVEAALTHLIKEKKVWKNAHGIGVTKQ